MENVQKCLESVSVIVLCLSDLSPVNYNLFSEPLGAGNDQSLAVENEFITIIQSGALEWLRIRHCGI